MLKKIFAVMLLAVTFAFQVQVDARMNFQYQAHIQNYGWLPPVKNGEATGTTGKNLRMEAVLINLLDGSKNMIQYCAHVQDMGWQSWQTSGGVAGTVGKNLRLEAICIQLTNGYENKFDIYYRTHIQNYGWLGWAKNGEPAGSSGASLRMEALQITLVNKGERFDRGGPAYLEKKNTARGGIRI